MAPGKFLSYLFDRVDVVKACYLLLLSVLALTLLGIVMVFSASAPSAISENQPVTSYFFDQIKFFIVAIIIAGVIWKFIPWSAWSGPLFWIVYIGSLVLILLTAVMGTESHGAKRWLLLGPVSVQSSEFFKITVVMLAAKIMSDLRSGEFSDQNGYLDRQRVGFMVSLVILPLGFMYLSQSDLGTSAIIAAGILAVLWFGEVPSKYVFGIIGICILGIIASIALVPYRSGRMLYLNPWDDGQGGYGAGYQIIRSFYAFSEGGLTGVGLGDSREKFLYLPESETDFVFSIIGEELGLIGTTFVLLAFLIVLFASLRIAKEAWDDYGTMVAGSLGVMIVFQAFLNIGCVIGAFPTTGKPLPFVSSGGSSLVATYIMIALIFSVAKDSIDPSFYKKKRENLQVIRTTDENDISEDMNPRRRSNRRPSNSEFGSRSSRASRDSFDSAPRNRDRGTSPNRRNSYSSNRSRRY